MECTLGGWAKRSSVYVEGVVIEFGYPEESVSWALPTLIKEGLYR